MTMATAQRLAATVISHQRDDLRECLTACASRYDDPIEGSALALDLGAQRDVVTWARYSIAGSFSAAVETVDGLERLLCTATPLPIPAMALSRSLTEVAALTCHLLDPTISEATRLARMAAQLIRDTQSGADALPAVAPNATDELARLTSARSDAHALLREIGFTIVDYRKREGVARSISYHGGDEEEIHVRFTRVVERYVPRSAYAVTSGAVHLQPWMTRGLEGDWETVVGTVLFPLLDTCDAIFANVLAYCGESPDRWHARTHRRRVPLLRAIRGDEGAVWGWREHLRNSGPTTSKEKELL